jgi:very-short-patch-repair endonuclease
MARDLDGTIAVRSLQLLGLLTIRMLDELGVSRQHRRTLIAHGVLVPVHRGVYRHAAHPVTWRQRVLAAVLAVGDRALASHETGGVLWRFEGSEQTVGVSLSIIPPGQRRPPAGTTLHRPLVLDPADRDQVGPIPVTSAARTFCDLAPRLSDSQLETVLDHACRRGQIWLPHLRWRLDDLQIRGRKDLPRVRALVDSGIRFGDGESWLETEGLRRITEAGLPLPRCQVKRAAGNGRWARVDLFWDAARLIVELDGHATHATRRARQADAERDAALELAGWRVVRFTYEDVTERPDHVVATIAAHLAQLHPARPA